MKDPVNNLNGNSFRGRCRAVLPLLLAAVLILSLAACGKNSSKEEEAQQAAAEEQAAQEEEVKEEVYVPPVHEEGKLYVGVLQQASHGALNETTEGLKDGLSDAFGEDVVVDVRVADGTKAGCDKIMEQIVQDGDDLIVAEGSAALSSAYEATKDIPIVGAAVTDFIMAGGVSSVDEPGANVTGVSDLPPMVTQKDALAALSGYEGGIGIVFTEGETGSRFQSELMEKYLDDDGLSWTEYRISDVSQISSTLEKACSECKVLYLPADNILAMNMAAVKEASLKNGTKVFTSAKSMCEAGGLVTISVDYYALGKRAAEMTDEILTYGTEKGRKKYDISEEEADEEDLGDPSDMSIDRVRDTAAGYYNPEIAEAIGWTPTGDYTALEIESEAGTETETGAGTEAGAEAGTDAGDAAR